MPYISEHEASQINGLPPNILPNARRRGVAPRHVVFGSRAYYQQADVEAWIQCRTRAASVPDTEVTGNANVGVDHA